MRNLSGDECSHTDVSYEVFERVLRERDDALEVSEARRQHAINCQRERDEAREALREIFYLYDVDFEFYAKRWPWLINTSCGHPPKSARCEQCLPWEEK